MTDTKADPGRSRRPAFLLLALGLIGVSICAVSLFANVTLGEAESFIAAPLHSAALANYAQDPIGGRLQSLSIRIIEFAIQDREPETDDAGARATDVVESLKSPVPTVTPKPGDPTYTPTAADTAVPTATAGSSTTPTPTSSPTRTPTRTPSLTPTDLPTAGPSATPSKTPTPVPSSTATNTAPPSNTPTPCKVAPYIEISSPNDGQRFTLAQELPGEAFAFDPDNANPVTCSTTPPGTNGQGIPVTATPTPAVEFNIERWNGASWVAVHYQAQNVPAYCAFTGSAICLTHDLSSGQWPNSTPITTGLPRLKARVVRDDEGVASVWVSANFYIDPLATSTPSPTATHTPTPTATLPPTATPTPSCASYLLSSFNGSSNDIRWTLTNGPSAATIIGIDLEWTLSGALNNIELDSLTIWNVGDPTSPANITSGWTAVSRLFNPFESKELWFNFTNSVGGSTFTVTVHFNNGCDVSATDSA